MRNEPLAVVKSLDLYLGMCDEGTYIVSPVLTADGLQYSDAKDTTTANTDITVFEALLPPKLIPARKAVGYYMNLSFQLCAVSNAAAVMKYQWQARNIAVVGAATGTWTNLFAQTTVTPGLAYVTYNWKGKLRAQAQVNMLPITIRLRLQCDTLNEGRGRIVISDGTSECSLVTVYFKD